MSFDCYPSILVPCLMASEALGMSYVQMFCQEHSAGTWLCPFVFMVMGASVVELSGSNRDQEAENDDCPSAAHAC